MEQAIKEGFILDVLQGYMSFRRTLSSWQGLMRMDMNTTRIRRCVF